MADEFLKVRGESDNSVILFSGNLVHRNNTWTLDAMMNYFVVGFNVFEADGGRIRFRLNTKGGYWAHVTGIHAMVGESLKLDDQTTNRVDANDGAFWMASSINDDDDRVCTIREFHQENKDNHTWHSTIAYDGSKIMSYNLIIVGWIEKL